MKARITTKARVARFFFTQNTKTRETITKYHNITKCHKIYQITGKYSK
jgi:hypothetical protein